MSLQLAARGPNAPLPVPLPESTSHEHTTPPSPTDSSNPAAPNVPTSNYSQYMLETSAMPPLQHWREGGRETQCMVVKVAVHTRCPLGVIQGLLNMEYRTLYSQKFSTGEKFCLSPPALLGKTFVLHIFYLTLMLWQPLLYN